MEAPLELLKLLANDYRLTHSLWNASLACLAYDYFLTLGDEVRFIWGKKLTRARILFWMNRYWAIINSIICNILLDWHNPSEALCQFSFKWFAYTAFLSHFSIGAILTLRIYAIYNSKRAVLYVLLTLLCIELVTEITLIVVISKQFTVLHLPSNFPGCAPINNVTYAWAYWIPMTLFESALFLLAAAKAVHYIFSEEARMHTPNLAFILVRDSLLYFGSVVALIILNLVIWVVGRDSLFSVFLLAIPAFHSILGCRMLLNMHQAINHHLDDDTALNNTIPLRTLKFYKSTANEQDTALLGTTVCSSEQTRIASTSSAVA